MEGGNEEAQFTAMERPERKFDTWQLPTIDN